MKQYFSEKCKMIFIKNKFNSLEPLYYQAAVSNNGKVQAKKIQPKTIYWDFILFARFTSRTVDKRTGDVSPGYLEAYQYAIAFQIIDSCMNLASEDILGALSRQSGKSHIVRLTLAFCLIFVPLYKFITEERFYVVYSAPKRGIAKDQYRKIKPHVEDAIELFNELYPTTPLLTRKSDKSLIDNEEKFEVNRVFGEKTIPYSSLDVLTLNKTVINAGLKNILCICEPRINLSNCWKLLKLYKLQRNL